MIELAAEIFERHGCRQLDDLGLGMTTADDIAEATLFLASDKAKNISGQVLRSVNSGEPAG